MRLRAPTDQCAWHGDGAGRSHQSAASDIKVDPSFDVSHTHDIVGWARAVVPTHFEDMRRGSKRDGKKE